MFSPRIFFTAILTGLLCFSTTVHAQRADNDGIGTSNSSNGVSIDLGTATAEPMLVAYPKMATSSISVRLSGIVDGSYLMGIKDEFGTVLIQGMMHVQDGIPLVIDIEKVETGIYTVFAIIDSVEYSCGFNKVD